MAKLFDRIANITFGKRGEAGTFIQGLRVKFSVEKTSESNANTAKIQIFNMNKSHRQELENTELFIILNAGYKGSGDNELIGVLFQGDISKTSTSRLGPDFITTIESGDGELALLNNHFEKSYGAGTFLTTIIEDLKGGLSNVAEGVIEGLGAQQFVNGGAISGKIKDILDSLTERMGLEWNIQNEELHISKPETKRTEQAILLNAKTGLISTPIKRETGIEATAFLNSKIVPGATVKIESDNLQNKGGFFRVRKSVFKGDTHGKDWSVSFEAL